uniref:zinc finger protein 512B-like n=1 Tax=Oncorhynchus gorbuscha TaxID=8017 RepID=UPI001EAF12C6|nr:zinc finger protein 512B-like [Oncorhynchus gorbuscha]
MEIPSILRLAKLSSRGRPPKQAHPQETARTTATAPENNKHSTPCSERGEGKKKGRPEEQELRRIPANMMVQWKEEFKKRSRVTCPGSGCWLEFPSIYGLKYHYQRCQGVTLAERLSHGCPDCKAVFATKVSLQKHKLWNHPIETKAGPKLHKTSVKGTAKKRPMENTPLLPVFFKVKKTQEVSSPFQNGECAPQRGERKQHPHPQPPSSGPPHLTPPPTPRGAARAKMRGAVYSHHTPMKTMRGQGTPGRKQKTPKKFTGEQPSISGTFGLKGMNKVEEKLKAGRVKRLEGGLFSEEPQRKHPGPASRRDLPPLTSAEAQWQHAISERGEVLCPTCSIITRKTISGLKKHMEICRKLQDALKCQQCQKQFRSKAGLNYHTMSEHSSEALGSEDQMEDVQEGRERLRRVLKQTGRIKCPKESCSAHFFSLMGYQYHQKRCGRQLSEEDKPVFLCQHCGKTYRSKTGRDYHLCTEHPTTNNNTTGRGREREGLGEDFERTPSGRVRRRSAQVAVFHLQEIAEDELDKDWGTKRDDLVPDSKRLNYTRPGLPMFSPKLLESWKNEVKEKGFICCSNGSCEAVYSSVSGLKAHLANCNQAEGDAGKYTCLLCQKEFSSESGVKYHISKTHSQNWFRAFSHMLPSSSRSKPPDYQGKTEVKNGATMGKKRGRKPKERPPEATPVQTNTFFSTTQNSTPTLNMGQTPVLTETGNPGSLTLNRQPNQPTTRRSKPKWVPPPPE